MTQNSIIEIPEIQIKLDTFPKISACIVTKDNTDQLFGCIDSLMRQAYPNMEILIQDTGSNYDSRLKMKKYFNSFRNVYPVVNLKDFYGKTYNYSQNNNDLVNLTSEDSELLLFLNNDVELINDNLTQFVSLFNKDVNEHIGTLGSQLIFQDQTIQHNGIFISRNVNNQFDMGHHDYGTQKYRYDITENIGNTGAVMMMRKSLFQEIGGFDPKLKLFQDVKLNVECIKRNKKNYTVHSALAYHFESQTRLTDDKKRLEDHLYMKKDLISMQNYLKQNIAPINRLLFGIREKVV